MKIAHLRLVGPRPGVGHRYDPARVELMSAFAQENVAHLERLPHLVRERRAPDALPALPCPGGVACR